LISRCLTTSIFFLRLVVDHAGDQVLELDRVALILEELELEGLDAAGRWCWYSNFLPSSASAPM
jgi:hypothetical protein